ncbi:DUF2085 domain-containing protein [Halorubrum sp. FL23]|uniref:DUF2085 domain-containing protein n=1 Tax=Halorubrum sp. FL23 TaxID=3458704 RepID=UPI004033F0E3
MIGGFIEYIFVISQKLRSYPFCHSLPKRSLCYNGRYFGLCARCTTMYFGGLLAILSFPVWSGGISINYILFIGLLLITPAGIDGTTQMFGSRESNNKLRVTTGFFLGLGIPILCWGGLRVITG